MLSHDTPVATPEQIMKPEDKKEWEKVLIEAILQPYIVMGLFPSMKNIEDAFGAYTDDTDQYNRDYRTALELIKNKENLKPIKELMKSVVDELHAFDPYNAKQHKSKSIDALMAQLETNTQKNIHDLATQIVEIIHLVHSQKKQN